MTFWPTNEAGKPTMQGFGAALQGAAPLLLNMGAGMMGGNASAGVQNGLAAMMAMEQRKKEEERYEREQQLEAQRYGDQQARYDRQFGLQSAEFDWRRNQANREWDWQRTEAERAAEAQQAQMAGMSDFFGSMMGPGPGQPGYQGATPFEPVSRNDAMASMGGPTNEAAAMMNDPSLAVIQRFEGFRESPYWDVNAHRAGFGSDTVTTADGRVVPVTPETRVSRADANRDLMRRVQTEFQPAVARAVGQDAWASMDDRQKAALTSLTYNYGAGAWDDDLAPVAAAVRSGDPRNVAVAIDRLGSHNGGVNARRRRMEAMLFANGGGGQPQQPQQPRVDPTRLAQIMLSDAIPAQVKTYAFQQAFPDNDPANLQRFEGPDGGVYSFDPRSGAVEPIMEPGAPEPSAAEQKIARLESTGIPRDVAVKIADGVYTTSRDPLTGETVVVDKSSGGVVFGNAPQEDSAPGPDTTAAAPGPRATTPAPGGSPDLDFGQDVPTGGASAFGVSGMFRRGVNAASDAVGAGEVFPETAEQQRFFRLIEEDLLVDLSQAYGRQPAQALMERIRSLLPQAGTLEGAETARGELAQLERRFTRDLENAQRSLGHRQRPEDRVETTNLVAGLKSTLSTIKEAQQRLGGAPGGGNQTTSSGVSWSIEE